MKLAIIEKYPSGINYSDYFTSDFDLFSLVSQKMEKILKKDIELDFNPDEYDFVILVGAEPCKHIGKISSVTKYQGYLVDGKFLPLTSPHAAKIKPEGLPYFEKAVLNINKYLTGDISDEAEYKLVPITESNEALEYINKIICDPCDKIAVDTETSALYPRDGYVLGISLTYKDNEGCYIDTGCIDEEVQESLQSLFLSKTCIFHNAKFDISFLKYHFGFEFPKFEDTLLLHYCLNEETGTHGLKDLAIKFTDLGDYEQELDIFKKEFCKQHKVKVGDFTYDLIPFEIMYPYACKDTIATLKLYNKFYDKVANSANLYRVYSTILKPATIFLITMEGHGIPFDKDRLEYAQQKLQQEIEELKNHLYTFKEVHQLEAETGTKFNSNSVIQIRKLLFGIMKLIPSGIMTDGKEHSTDEESLEIISEQHEIAKILLKIRKLGKLSSTYINKILIGLNADSRLRTGFHLFTTTSGRLSSSGKLNMQQLPRDSKLVKGCIRANKGWKIISQDLVTGEMYIAAVLSGDKKLQDIFHSGQDFHSTIGKMVYNLDCTIDQVKTLFPQARQISKTLAFAILYGAGPDKVADTAGISLLEAKELINWYYKTFKQLKKWLDNQKKFIEEHGFIYSAFGRKRRVPNVFSSTRHIKEHAVRSAINFLVQSVASDINLIAAMNMQAFIEENKMKAKIIALVHDSIVAEVPDNEVEVYSKKLKEITQQDYGCSIPKQPIGVECEISEDYSFSDYWELKEAA